MEFLITSKDTQGFSVCLSTVLRPNRRLLQGNASTWLGTFLNLHYKKLTWGRANKQTCRTVWVKSHSLSNFDLRQSISLVYTCHFSFAVLHSRCDLSHIAPTYPIREQRYRRTTAQPAPIRNARITVKSASKALYVTGPWSPYSSTRAGNGDIGSPLPSLPLKISLIHVKGLCNASADRQYEGKNRG